jgi:drug/metabolite transporter (DMT)-like permease
LEGPALALASALGYGISDFVGGIASRRVAALRVVLVSYPIALALLAVIASIVGGQVTGSAIFWGALCGVSQAFGVWWFYAALGAGPISVVSPLTAILVAGIPVGIGLALGERPGFIAAIGVVLALVAVVLVSREATDEDARPHRFTAGVAWLTVGSGIAFGLNFVLINQAPTVIPLRLAVLAAVLDTGANIAMLLALHASLLSLAGVLMSLYPAATVLLAIVVLNERVTRWQTVGMVAALVSVAMIAAG